MAKLNAKKERETNAHSCKLYCTELSWQAALLSFHFFSFFFFFFCTSGLRKKSLVPAEMEMDVWVPFLFDYTQLCRVILDEKGAAFSQITCNGELQKLVCNCMCPPLLSHLCFHSDLQKMHTNAPLSSGCFLSLNKRRRDKQRKGSSFSIQNNDQLFSSLHITSKFSQQFAQ